MVKPSFDPRQKQLVYFHRQRRQQSTCNLLLLLPCTAASPIPLIRPVGRVHDALIRPVAQVHGALIVWVRVYSTPMLSG